MSPANALAVERQRFALREFAFGDDAHGCDAGAGEGQPSGSRVPVELQQRFRRVFGDACRLTPHETPLEA